MSTDQWADENPNPMHVSKKARTGMNPAVHYSPGSEPGPAACGLQAVPPERLTADLDAVTCGNCLSGLPWRNDMSQRSYKRDYERFYGPGGFLDRAGQTAPASATTAPQARAALERLIEDEAAKAARLGSQGAGSTVIARAVRDAARAIANGADHCIRLALADAGTAAAGRTVTFDLADATASFVLTEALEEFAARQRDQATDEHGHEMRERWADLADRMRGQAEAAG